MTLRISVATLSLLVVTLALTGCGGSEEPTVYTAPEEEPPAVQPNVAVEGPSSAPAATPGVAPMGASATDMRQQTLPESALNRTGNPDWTVPASWEVAEGSAMRRGSFAVTGEEGTLDIAVTSFPGDVGGTLANVNRWRQQIGLSPVTEAGLSDLVETFQSSHYTVDLVHLEGAREATLAATLMHEGNSWFFKMTGPATLVEKERPAFLAFVRSVHFPH
ncbi:MAG: hypothetical protein ACLFR7_01220 [Opitutales bacterium]